MAASPEASSVVTSEPRPHPPSAQLTGRSFVVHYYRILHSSPERAHLFYKDVSKISRPEEDGSMSITTTMDGIKAKILSLNYDKLRTEIESVGAQDSFDGAIAVLVTGRLIGRDNNNNQARLSVFLPGSSRERLLFAERRVLLHLRMRNLAEEKKCHQKATFC